MIKRCLLFVLLSLICSISFSKTDQMRSTEYIQQTLCEIEKTIKEPLKSEVQNIVPGQVQYDINFNKKYNLIPKNGDFNLWAVCYTYLNNHIFGINSYFPYPTLDEKFEIIISRGYTGYGRRIITDKNHVIRGFVSYVLDWDSDWVGYSNNIDSDYNWLKEFAVERMNVCNKKNKTGYIVFEAKYGYVIIGFYGLNEKNTPGFVNVNKNGKRIRKDFPYKYITYRAFIDKGYIRDSRLPARKSSLPKINLNDYIDRTPK